MQITVVIEPIEDGRFRARTGEPLALAAEAETREQALAALRGLVQRHLEKGTELVSLQVGAPSHALPAGAGVFKDDPLFDEWQEAIAEYRRNKDEQEGIR